MATRLFRIDLTQPNIEDRVSNKCDAQSNQGYRLAAAFEAENRLVLIFQDDPPPQD